LLEKLGRLDALKALIVLAAFLAPITIAAGVSEEPVLESSRALAVSLGAGWLASAFVGYGFYGGKRCLEAATLLTLVALVVFVACARPWVGEETEENVIFWYEASFTYLGSIDNEPIENVALRFPCPTIENKSPYVPIPNWALYYLDENSQLHLQMTDQVVIGWMGGRTDALSILAFGLEENTRHGVKISYVLNKLYPHEVFLITTFLLIAPEKYSKITLSEQEDNQKTAAYYHYPLEQKIDMSFLVQLSKKTDDNFERLEEFNRIAENAEYGWWWLYPS